jgi:hypothetical protein
LPCAPLRRLLRQPPGTGGCVDISLNGPSPFDARESSSLWKERIEHMHVHLHRQMHDASRKRDNTNE